MSGARLEHCLRNFGLCFKNASAKSITCPSQTNLFFFKLYVYLLKHLCLFSNVPSILVLSLSLRVYCCLPCLKHFLHSLPLQILIKSLRLMVKSSCPLFHTLQPSESLVRTKPINILQKPFYRKSFFSITKFPLPFHLFKMIILLFLLCTVFPGSLQAQGAVGPVAKPCFNLTVPVTITSNKLHLGYFRVL
jgi:hypothetical protein